MMVTCGRVTPQGLSELDGVWVLDHAASTFTPATVTAKVETAWIRVPRSLARGSPITAYLWLRETYNGSATVNVYRDYRSTNAVMSTTALLYAEDDTPPFWGSTTLRAATTDSGAKLWQKRRPSWRRIHLHIPSCETFKLAISAANDFEFIAISFDELDRSEPARIPP
jgi:hypothetical protein